MNAGRDCDPTLTPAALARDYDSAILAICLANTHGLEDVLQDTPVKAMACPHHLREPGQLRAWILQIARRLCRVRLMLHNMLAGDEP